MYVILTGDSTVVHCDSCTFVIPTDCHGNPLSGILCPVRISYNYDVIVMSLPSR